MNFPRMPLVDNFNRADGGLGTKWTSPLWFGDASPAIASNTVKATTSGYSSTYFNTPFVGGLVEAYIQIPTKTGDGNDIGLVIRGQSPGTTSLSGYYIKYSQKVGTDTLTLLRIDNEAETSLSTISIELSAGDWIGAESLSSGALAYYYYTSGAWTLAGTATDTTYTGKGYSGFYMHATTGRLDNFSGGSLGGRLLTVMGVG